VEIETFAQRDIVDPSIVGQGMNFGHLRSDLAFVVHAKKGVVHCPSMIGCNERRVEDGIKGIQRRERHKSERPLPRRLSMNSGGTQRGCGTTKEIAAAHVFSSLDPGESMPGLVDTTMSGKPHGGPASRYRLGEWGYAIASRPT
jgi:hypothetical protein